MRTNSTSTWFAMLLAIALPFTLTACEDSADDVLEPTPAGGDIAGTVVAGNNQLANVDVTISGPTALDRARGAEPLA